MVIRRAVQRLCLFVAIFVFTLPVTAEEISTTYTYTLEKSYPTADVSFLIADLKYNERDGVKICEVQHGSLSVLRGYDFLYGGAEIVAEKFCDFLSQYQSNAWFLKNTILYGPFNTTFVNRGWIPAAGMMTLSKDSFFQECSSMSVYDPSSIYDYHGVLYAKPGTLESIEKFRNNNPGILLIDRVTFPYWIDKYKMSILFTQDQRLARYKPRWGLYAKKYSSGLAQKIINDIKSEIFVIKPRGAFLGNGVIIVAKENLDATLRTILKKKKKQIILSDPSYSHWKYDSFDSFLVEEFIESDPVTVPHLENQQYDGTLRVIFFLSYQQKEIQSVLMKGYWYLPKKNLSQKGTLNERHKSHIADGYNAAITPAVRQKVEEQLQEAIYLLYRQMLEADHKSAIPAGNFTTEFTESTERNLRFYERVYF
ncbi:MAG: hypothetical protein K940chlam7_01002 [Chlamydiae bacterium]|nr:hypothetical protein [Chlamydiota bacterium]